MSVQTLLEVASAFDVALEVKFVTHKKFIEGIQDLSPAAMHVASFTEMDFAEITLHEFKEVRIDPNQLSYEQKYLAPQIHNRLVTECA